MRTSEASTSLKNGNCSARMRVNTSCEVWGIGAHKPSVLLLRAALAGGLN